MEADEHGQDLTSRRSFLLKGAVVGAAGLGAGGLLAGTPEALASNGRLAAGDVAILRSSPRPS